jgi:hypothetical protein
LITSKEKQRYERKDENSLERGEMSPSALNNDDLQRSERENVVVMTNMQDQLINIIEQDGVEDVIDLNEKFLSMALGGIDVSELAGLTKIELRVDTSCHSLYVTGEILQSLEYLKLNDSVIRCFRDIGTSFKNVRVLHLARCEIKEV